MLYATRVAAKTQNNFDIDVKPVCHSTHSSADQSSVDEEDEEEEEQEETKK